MGPAGPELPHSQALVAHHGHQIAAISGHLDDRMLKHPSIHGELASSSPAIMIVDETDMRYGLAARPCGKDAQMAA
jgi:hypothetical protein